MHPMDLHERPEHHQEEQPEESVEVTSTVPDGPVVQLSWHCVGIESYEQYVILLGEALNYLTGKVEEAMPRLDDESQSSDSEGVLEVESSS